MQGRATPSFQEAVLEKLQSAIPHKPSSPCKPTCIDGNKGGGAPQSGRFRTGKRTWSRLVRVVSVAWPSTGTMFRKQPVPATSGSGGLPVGEGYGTAMAS